MPGWGRVGAMHFKVITLFSEAIEAYVRTSILGRAQGEKLFRVTYFDPRNFANDIRKTVDMRPFGGGPGMVMTAEPILKAWLAATERALGTETKRRSIAEKALGKSAHHSRSISAKGKRSGKKAIGASAKRIKTIVFAADGMPLSNDYARALAKKYDEVILICGRYEGVDERVAKITKAEKVSIGSYILTGGEVPAMALIDATMRQVEGVLGAIESLEERRVAGSTVYTRPETLAWEGKTYRVPKVLLSGHHQKIEEWKKSKKK